MTLSVLVLVPFASALCYVGLLTLVRRHSVRSSRWVLIYLAVLMSWSITGLIWRALGDGPVREALRRILEAQAMSLGALFLYVLQSQYPSRWGSRARAIGLLTVVAICAVTLSGILDRVFIEGDSTAPAWMAASMYTIVSLWAGSYFFALGYVVFHYRHERDPFERNRLKYAAASAAAVMLGSASNMIPALRALPADHAANLVAASLLAFSAARYRLFDIDVVPQRSLIRVIALLPSIMFSIVGLGLAFPVMRPELGTLGGVALALAVMSSIAVTAPFLRIGIERAIDHLFVGGHVEHAEAVRAFTRRTIELHDVHAIARELAELCQWATDSGCAAVLLLDRERNRLVLAEMSGPFQRLQPEWTICADNPLLTAIARRGEALTPFTTEQLLAAEDFQHADVAEFMPYRDHVAAPILARGDVVGCIFVAPKVYDGTFSLEELDVLTVVAGQAGLAIQSATAFEQLREHAQTDYLTGLPNHRHLQELLKELLGEPGGEAAPFAVAMIDIDNFKMLNDVHGHLVGDEALKRIAAAFRESLRPVDIVGRYGGDEFLVLMPGLSRSDGNEVMTQLARNIRRLALAAPRESEDSTETRLPVRISWGLAAYPERGITARSLISAADSELLQQRFAMRRSGSVHTDRPTVRELLEQDPEKLRVARALLDIIDAKDPYTSEHSQQIAAFALLVAEEMALPDRERYALWLGSLLHDVGKIGTPSHVLRKPGRLTPEEWDLMRQHPALGESIVRGLLDMPEVIDIVGCHHERYDGNGYPRGLAGEDIPRMARIVSVADAFSAMVHDRPYRKGLTWAEATTELQRAGGTQLDPQFVEAFVRAIGHEQQQLPAAAA